MIALYLATAVFAAVVLSTIIIYVQVKAECDFCHKPAIHKINGHEVINKVCSDHLFLLDCDHDAIYRALLWKTVGFNYTKDYHEHFIRGLDTRGKNDSSE